MEVAGSYWDRYREKSYVEQMFCARWRRMAVWTVVAMLVA